MINRGKHSHLCVEMAVANLGSGLQPRSSRTRLLGLHAYQGPGGFAVPNDYQRGDAHNPKLGGQPVFCVDVHLAHPDFRMLGGDLLHHGAIMRQGPHQEAQKSRSTGTGEESTSWLKFSWVMVKTDILYPTFRMI